MALGAAAFVAALRLHRLRASRFVAPLALVAVLVGLTFHAVLTVWLFWSGRYEDLLYWPLVGDASIHMSVMLGLSLGLFVIWSGLVQTRIGE